MNHDGTTTSKPHDLEGRVNFATSSEVNFGERKPA